MSDGHRASSHHIQLSEMNEPFETPFVGEVRNRRKRWTRGTACRQSRPGFPTQPAHPAIEAVLSNEHLVHEIMLQCDLRSLQTLSMCCRSWNALKNTLSSESWAVIAAKELGERRCGLPPLRLRLPVALLTSRRWAPQGRTFELFRTRVATVSWQRCSTRASRMPSWTPCVA